MKRILITGFEPFSDIKKNPSETLVDDLFLRLQKENLVDVQKKIFPVDYQKAEHDLDRIDFEGYDFVFQFGVAAKRTRVCLERVALNWIESSIPDNSGTRLNCRPIDILLDSAKINSLDLQEIAGRLNLEFPEAIEVSLSAGAYLCNYVYFKTLSKTPKCLFVHIPTELKYKNQECTHGSQTYREILMAISHRLIQIVI